jgi:hypothetical protein
LQIVDQKSIVLCQQADLTAALEWEERLGMLLQQSAQFDSGGFASSRIPRRTTRTADRAVPWWSLSSGSCSSYPESSISSCGEIGRKIRLCLLTFADRRSPSTSRAGAGWRIEAPIDDSVSEPRGDRTHDPRLKRPVLCQLS